MSWPAPHPTPEIIFVFGSNQAGRHGAGAALTARRKWGAIYGQGEGRQGRAYGIPTKDRKLNPLPLIEIHAAVDRFLDYARNHLTLTFQVTAIGTGLAGYDHWQIGPMFQGAPENCRLPIEWDFYL